jgi:hypothetical protein
LPCRNELPTQTGHRKFSDAAALVLEANDGLNIEGLAATPEKKLLIGFRNPIRSQRALLASLENPREVMQGKAARYGRNFRGSQINAGHTLWNANVISYELNRSN